MPTPKKIFPYLLFGLLCAYLFYPLYPANQRIPAYGDTLEVLWGIEWLGQRLLNHQSVLFTTDLFAPVGWQTLTFAHGPFLFLLLLPFYLVGGGAFAYNSVMILVFGGTFTGCWKIYRRFLTWQTALVLALAYSFWGMQLARAGGQLNLLTGNGLVVWMILLAEKFNATNKRLWLGLAGLCWAMAIGCSPYFLWFGGVSWVLWNGGKRSKEKSWQQWIEILLLPTVVALGVATPYLWWVKKVSPNSSYFGLAEIANWGIDLKGIPAYFIGNPWLGQLSFSWYGKEINETTLVNFGMGKTILGVLGLFLLAKTEKGRSVVWLAIGTLILSLGPFLRGGNRPILWEAAAPLTQLLWTWGHYFQPAIFSTPLPPTQLANAIPAPWLVLAIFVPFWASARTACRWGMVAGLGIFLSAGQTIDRQSRVSIRYLLLGMILLEGIVWPQQAVAYPPPSHPAWSALAKEATPPTILELYPISPSIAAPLIGGSAQYATLFHRGRLTFGGGSVFPTSTKSLVEWLFAHPHPFSDEEWPSILQQYQVDVVAIHLTTKLSYADLDWGETPLLDLIDCYAPTAPTVWNYPICLFRVKKAALSADALLYGFGWSPAEPWGRWAIGDTSHARWLVIQPHNYQLTLEAFPNCIPDQPQQLTVTVNQQPIATHQWEKCEPWLETITIPSEKLRVGWNDLTFSYRYGIAPSEQTQGANPDARPLSVGFSQLRLEEEK